MTSVTAKAVTFTNGTANDATQVDSEMTNLFNNDSTLATAVTTIENDYTTRGNITEFIGGMVPAYASASTFTVAKGRSTDSSQSVMMTTTVAKTVDISTTGLNGVAQSSSNLTGTISTSGSSTTVTGSGTAFSTELQVGDVIYPVTTGVSGARRVTAIASNTSLTVESAVTLSSQSFKRGSEAPSTWYNLYMISDGVTPGFLLSTRNVAAGDTLVNLPTGYTYYRQLPFAVRNNSSSNIVAFYVSAGWPYRPLILYHQAQTALATWGTSTSSADIVCSTQIPPISKLGWFEFDMSNNSATGRFLTITDNGGTWSWVSGTYDADNFYTRQKLQMYFGTDANQTIDYDWSGAPAEGLAVDVMGFVVTEVA